MRDYAKFAPTFWTGPTGKKIRAAGRDAQLLACYLFTCPASSMYGLYYLAIPTLCYEAGFSDPEARATIRVLEGLGFAMYDEEAELVWVIEAARYQIDEALKPSDHRVKGISALLGSLRRHPFARLFYLKYRKAYSLPVMTFGKALTRVSQGPPKPREGTGEGEGTEAVTGAEADQSDDLSAERSNPLAPDRTALESECLRLVREIAATTGKDPTEVMAEAGTWKGGRKINPASMSPDRLLNTVLDLRRMRDGKPARDPTPANPRAQERQAGAVAMIRGGMRDERGMESWDGGSREQLEGPGSEHRNAPGPRGLIPPRTGAGER